MKEKLVHKLITLTQEDKEAIEKIAKEETMTSNQLIRLIIRKYLKMREEK